MPGDNGIDSASRIGGGSMKPHHGEIKELSEAESTELLARNQFGHLACHLKDDIFLVPISYVYEDGYIYSHSQDGKKIHMMRKSPRVCVQVEEVKDFFHWRSVLAWGKFEELKDEDASIAMHNIVKKLATGEQRRSELEVYFESQLESAIMYRIKVETITGRYENGFVGQEQAQSL